MAKYRYSWTKKFGADPQAVGEWLQGLGTRSADAIVQAAADPKSPAHSIIWGIPDNDAAQEYRRVLARVITSSLRIEIIDSKNKPQQISAFITSADRTGYVMTLEATEEELTAAERDCWKQMQRFKQRYASLKFAEDVVLAIQETERRAVRRKKHR